MYDSDQPAFNDDLLSLNLPILGLCYGHQLICQRLGGEVVPGEVREYGTADLRILANEGPFAGLGTEETVWMSHGDTVSRLPDGFELIGETPDCPAAAVGDPERRIYGFQFHPEFDWQLIEEAADRSDREFKEAGITKARFLEQLKPQYPEARRLARRIFESVALCLMPVDRASSGLVRDLHH